MLGNMSEHRTRWPRFVLLEATEHMILPSGRLSKTRRQTSVMERGSVVKTFNTQAEAVAWCEAQTR